jgi:hypothetical protein
VTPPSPPDPPVERNLGAFDAASPERFSAVQHEILSMVVSDLPLGATLERLADSVAGAATGTACTIHELDPPGVGLRLAAAPGFGPDARTPLDRAPLASFDGFPAGPGIRPISALEPSALTTTVADLGFTCVARAPIHARRGAELGTIALWSKEPIDPAGPVL